MRRRRERLADDSLVVILGGMLDTASLRTDADRTFRRFGERGVSVLAAPTDDDLDLLARTVLRRYQQLTVMTADVDWNTMDDTGLPWTLVDEAADPSQIVPGAFVIAGRDAAIAVAEVVDVGDDGVVHLRDIGGTVEANLHLVRKASSMSV